MKRSVSWRGNRAKRRPPAQDLAPIGNKEYRTFRRFALIVVFLCSVAQIIIDGSSNNIISLAMVFVGTMVILFGLVQPRNLQLFPISTWMVIFFAGSSMTIPLIAKTLEFESLIYELQVPIKTFWFELAGTTTLVAAHWIYTHANLWWKVRTSLSRNIFVPLNMFKGVTELQVWMFGLFGCIGFLIVMVTGRQGLQDSTTSAAKFCLPLVPFAFAPFILIFPNLYANKGLKPLNRTRIILLSIHFVLVVVLSLGANIRTGVALPFATVGISWFLGISTNRIPRSAYAPRILAIVGFSFVVLLPIVSTFFLAMQVARAQRGTVSAGELIQISLQTFTDSKTLQDAANLGSDNPDWSEVYVHNLILSRFVTTKFHDNGLFEIDQMGSSEQTQLWAFTADKLVSIIPKPILDLFGSNLDKKQSGSSSTGDFIHYLRTGVGLESFRTGSLLAIGHLSFGDFDMVVLFFACIPMFCVGDAFCLVRRKKNLPANHPQDFTTREVLFSPAVLFTVWEIIYANFEFESVFSWIEVIIRGTPQLLLYYYIIYKLTEKVGAITEAPDPLAPSARKSLAA